MYNSNNQFLKYLENQDEQILCDIDYLYELISLVESGRFESKREEKLEILRGMLRDREIDYERVRKLIEKIQNKNK